MQGDNQPVDKSGQTIEHMFSAVAPRYDLLNRLLMTAQFEIPYCAIIVLSGFITTQIESSHIWSYCLCVTVELEVSKSKIDMCIYVVRIDFNNFLKCLDCFLLTTCLNISRAKLVADESIIRVYLDSS